MKLFYTLTPDTDTPGGAMSDGRRTVEAISHDLCPTPPDGVAIVPSTDFPARTETGGGTGQNVLVISEGGRPQPSLAEVAARALVPAVLRRSVNVPNVHRLILATWELAGAPDPWVIRGRGKYVTIVNSSGDCVASDVLEEAAAWIAGVTTAAAENAQRPKMSDNTAR